MTERGVFILIEGCDGVGKSTQAKLLHDRIPNSVLLSFPDRETETGRLINRYLQGTENVNNNHSLHLLFSCNRWEKYDEIINLLESGKHVICDRYSYSGICYSVASGISCKWAQGTERGLPKPDVVVLLTRESLPLFDGSEKVKERYDDEMFQRKVSNIFELLLEPNWIKVEVQQDEKETSDVVYRIAKYTIKKNVNKTIQFIE